MRKALAVAWILLLFGGASGWAADCTSSTGCTDCGFGSDNKAKCTFVAYDAFCDCTVTVAYGGTACAMDGTCDYLPGGGSGGGTGGSGGSGGSCVRSPGGWCPAECTSCGTVYWN